MYTHTRTHTLTHHRTSFVKGKLITVLVLMRVFAARSLAAAAVFF